MLKCGAGDALVILLDHTSRDVVFAAAGALVNIGSDSDCNDCLTSFQDSQHDSQQQHRSQNGCVQLVHILRRAGLRDLVMASVATKALYNVLTSFTTSSSSSSSSLVGFGFEKIESALGTQLEVLHQSLDELIDVLQSDSQGGGGGGDGDNSEQVLHFTKPASALLSLLNRVLDHMTVKDSEPLPSSPSYDKFHPSNPSSSFDDIYENLPNDQPTLNNKNARK